MQLHQQPRGAPVEKQHVPVAEPAADAQTGDAAAESIDLRRTVTDPVVQGADLTKSAAAVLALDAQQIAVRVQHVIDHQQHIAPRSRLQTVRCLGITVDQSAQYLLMHGSLPPHASRIHALFRPAEEIAVDRNVEETEAFDKGDGAEIVFHVHIAAFFRQLQAAVPQQLRPPGGRGEAKIVHALAPADFLHGIDPVMLQIGIVMTDLRPIPGVFLRIGRDDQILPAGGKARHGTQKTRRIEPVVAVEHAKIPPGGALQPGVDGGAVAAVFLVDQNEHVWISLLIRAEDRQGAVCAAVVDGDHFQFVRKLLQQHGIETAVEIGLRVIHRHDDRKRFHGHVLTWRRRDAGRGARGFHTGYRSRPLRRSPVCARAPAR